MPEVESLGATVAIGGCLILGCVFIADSFVGWDLARSLRRRTETNTTPTAILLVIVSSAVGMTIRATSDYTVSKEPEERNCLQSLAAMGVSEWDLKLGVLKDESRLSDLGERLRERGLLRVRLPLCERQLDDAAPDLYYEAKNAVFREDTYFAELQQLQTRIDFARSLSAVSGLLAVWTFAMLLCSVGMLAWRVGKAEPCDHSSRLVHGLRMHSRRALRWPSALASVMVVLSMCWLAPKVYGHEEEQFNKRIFGYYMTLSGSSHASVSGTSERDRSSESARFATQPASRLSGISGMALYGRDYLVVHDTRWEDAPRLSLLSLADARGVRASPLRVDWSGQRPGQDLEAASAWPGSADEFIVVESSPHHGGRLMFIRLAAGSGTSEALLVAWCDLPGSVLGAVEGASCVSRPGGSDEERLLLLGERGSGGSGRLIWGRVELVGGRLEFTFIDSADVTLPGFAEGRAITGLFADTQSGEVWASAAVDPGDDGPFESIVYQVASIEAGGEVSVHPREPGWVLDGYKVEAVVARDGALMVAMDDEIFGASWRRLPAR